MTTEQRLAIVAHVCADLWRHHERINTDLATNRLIWRAEWDGDGYAGDYPWSRARRYVRAFLAGMKKEGLVDVITSGTEHYNAGGTLVDYALTPAGRRWLDDRAGRGEAGGGGGSWSP